MGKRNFKVKGFLENALLFEFLIICMNVITCYGQPGFLSIDCGTAANYTDTIGLSWVTDEPYISTGASSDLTFTINSSTVDNYRAMGDFRYFPDRQSKHCYDLPTISNISYLIRAMFYYDALESNVLRLPVVFKVFINSTDWFTARYVNIDDDYEYEFPTSEFPDGPLLVHEGIFYSPGSLIHFCLQPVVGVPFISSLELRPLDPEGIMYSYPASETRYLSKLARYNYGASVDAPTVRFPDDKFDRLWRGVETSNSIAIDNNIISGSTPLDNNTRAAVNNVPAKVMQDAEVFNYSSLNLAPFSVDLLYAAFYFKDLNVTKSPGGQLVTINFYDDRGDQEVYAGAPSNVTENTSMQAFPVVFGGETFIAFEITGNEADSGLPSPVGVNAFEIYGNYRFNFSTTWPADEEVIKNFKRIFNLNDWQGDPCFPVPYDGLTCTVHYTPDRNNGRVISSSFIKTITLSHLDKYGWLTFIKSPALLSTLIDISLTHSGINEDIFQFLIQNMSGISLRTLNLSYNVIKDIPPSSYWRDKQNLFSLDLSHNALEELSLLRMPFMSNVQVLNVSDNNLSGVFPNDVYFSNLTNSDFTIVNFDRNDIQGSLNLSTWHELLQQNMSAIGPLFSFVSNNITNINPSIEDFDAIIMFRLQNKNAYFNKTGVLLGGNPFCDGAKSITHKYLCRYSVNDIVVQVVAGKKNQKWLISFATVGGVLFFIISFVLLAISWKLWKQVSTLRQIQQALAHQKVKPPFYSYNELKLATRDFHRDNKLGSGAFGVVYKGELADGTVVAVKKLFNSQQVQVLNEFLNEVVLITGIKHKNLVQLKGCCINDKQRILIYDHVENGNLAEALWDKQTSKIPILDWQQRFNICVGIARGLSYLHEELQPRIIHRDIKPANILLDKNFNPKIADFGLARHFLDEQSQAQFTKVAGTRGYFAPEYATEGKLTEKADVFSFGILLLEIVSGRKVIDYDMPADRVFLKHWVQKLYKDDLLLEVLQPELQKNCVEAEVIRVIHIALICVEMDFEKRATMSQVVTMLLGSMDVAGFLDSARGSYYLPNFNTLLSVTHNHLNTMSTLHEGNTIDEECNETPLLQVDIESTMPSHSNLGANSIATIVDIESTMPSHSSLGANSIATIELSDVNVR